MKVQYNLSQKYLFLLDSIIVSYSFCIQIRLHTLYLYEINHVLNAQGLDIHTPNSS